MSNLAENNKIFKKGRNRTLLVEANKIWKIVTSDPVYKERAFEL